MGAIFGGGVALAFHDSASWFVLPAMLVAGMVGGMLWARDSRVPAHALQRQRDPRVADARLRRVADPVAARARRVARPGRLQFPAVEDVRRQRAAAQSARGDAAQRRLAARARRRGRGLALHAQEPRRLPDARGGPRARRGQLRGHLGVAHRVARHADRRRVRRHRRRRRGRRADRPAAAHRARRATASPRSSSRSSGACIRSASCSRACSCRCSTSAARPRR